MLKIKVDFELKSKLFARRLDGKVEGRYFNLLGVGAAKSPPPFLCSPGYREPHEPTLLRRIIRQTISELFGVT